MCVRVFFFLPFPGKLSICVERKMSVQIEVSVSLHLNKKTERVCALYLGGCVREKRNGAVYFGGYESDLGCRNPRNLFCRC